MRIKKEMLNFFKKLDFFLYIIYFFILLFIFYIFSHVDKNFLYEDTIIKRDEKIKDIKELYLKEEIIDENTTLSDKDFDLDTITNDSRLDYDKFIADLAQKIEKKEIELKQKKQVNYFYIPKIIEQKYISNPWILSIKDFINSNVLKSKNLDFILEFYFKKDVVRWKFYKNTIKLYSLVDIDSLELVSIFIHELGHYIDIQFLQKKVLFDPSDKFYEISWDYLDIIKPWLNKNDFVSWYAMTNKYEDFAESFIYYVLYNDDFRDKSQKSDIIKQKYDFFSKVVFSQDEFKKTNFRIDEELKDYYWDITKIKFSLKNFLDYFKK